MDRLGFAFVAVFWLCGQSAHATIDATPQTQLGNTFGAITDTNNQDHYFNQRTVEAIDYKDDLGEQVWASWDLTAARWRDCLQNPKYSPMARR